VAAIGDEDAGLRSHLVGEQYRVEYRAFLVDIDGQFVGCEPIICADDTEAIETAAGLVDGHDIKVWSGPRFAPF
jgi:lipopolysaccharide assembly protein A